MNTFQKPKIKEKRSKFIKQLGDLWQEFESKVLSMYDLAVISNLFEEESFESSNTFAYNDSVFEDLIKQELDKQDSISKYFEFHDRPNIVKN